MMTLPVDIFVHCHTKLEIYVVDDLRLVNRYFYKMYHNPQIVDDRCLLTKLFCNMFDDWINVHYMRNFVRDVFLGKRRFNLLMLNYSGLEWIDSLVERYFHEQIFKICLRSSPHFLSIAGYNVVLFDNVLLLSL